MSSLLKSFKSADVTKRRIYNPTTRRWVHLTGRLGKRLLKEYLAQKLILPSEVGVVYNPRTERLLLPHARTAQNLQRRRRERIEKAMRQPAQHAERSKRDMGRAEEQGIQRRKQLQQARKNKPVRRGPANPLLQEF